jgi:putative flippase GtrA
MQPFENIRAKFARINIYQISKYLGVSVVMYVSILLVMYIAVDITGISEIYAYVITYAFAYVADYLINSRYLFYSDHSWLTVLKYLIHFLFFLALGSVIFKLLLLTNMHYLIAILMSAAALFPFRFLAHKFLVFRD